MVGHTALLQLSLLLFLAQCRKDQQDLCLPSRAASRFPSDQSEERKENKSIRFSMLCVGLFWPPFEEQERLKQFWVSAVTTVALWAAVTDTLITPIYRLISWYFSSFFSLSHRYQFKVLSRVRGLHPTTRKFTSVSTREPVHLFWCVSRDIQKTQCTPESLVTLQRAPNPNSTLNGHGLKNNPSSFTISSRTGHRKTHVEEVVL